MSILTRLYDFVAGTKIRSAQVDAEFDQLVVGHNDHDVKIDGLQAGTGLTDGAVTTAKLATNAVTTAKITDANVTTAKITDANITTAKIADLNVTTAKIANLNVTQGKIALLAVGTDQLADLSVTNGKIATGVITADKFVDGALSNDTANALRITALETEDSSIKLADMSYLFNKDGIVSVITGDSLAYNMYDYDTGIGNGYDCYPGMASWSFMLRDAIHRNDKFFVHGDEALFRYSKATSSFSIAPSSNQNLAPFNGRYLDVTVTDNTEQITFTYKHYNRNSQKAVLYFLSNPNNNCCSFDVYLDGALATSIDLNGATKLYQGYEMQVASFACGAGALHEISLRNFVQTASVPEGAGQRKFQLLGIGTKYSRVYNTGAGSTDSAWLLTNITARILTYTPDFVTIITGTNDLHSSVPVATYESNLRSIVSQIRTAKSSTQILLLGKGSERNPSNEGVTGGGYYSDADSQPYINACKRVARDLNCYYVGLMDVFKNIPITDWRFDSVHMKKYGNALLARTVLKTLMPEGLYPYDLVDPLLIQYSNNKFGLSPVRVRGTANVKWNSGTSLYVIQSQSESLSVLSVTKTNVYTITIDFKYNAALNNVFSFVNIPVITQFAAGSLFVRHATFSLNSLSFFIYKADGTLSDAAYYTSNPNDYNFLITF